MTDESEKIQNKLRLSNLALQSLTKGVWDFVGETAFAMTPVIGENVLKILENELGLKIQGQKPEEAVSEIIRLFVDEFGTIKNYECHGDCDQKITVKVQSCILREFSAELLKAGVTRPFVCPLANACQAALKRLEIQSISKRSGKS